ncbi:hypothetical protein L7F22_046995 [Adiantum nelumboides]|nr:hypothetical protein [Adiantum nelumboides]
MKEGDHHDGEQLEGEVQYFFSDLPSNDFNALKMLADVQLQQHHEHAIHDHGRSQEELVKMRIYTAAVPGSFYARLFPSHSLDLVVWSYSLHWLSHVLLNIIPSSTY